MNRAEILHLRARWTKEQLVEAHNQLYTGKLTGGFFPKVLHGNVSFEDFRGFLLDLKLITAPSADLFFENWDKTPNPINFDFSYSQNIKYKSTWYFKSAVNCKFIKCNFYGLQIWENCFDCNFSDSKMTGGMLGHPWKGKFVRCNFHSCNMSRAQNHNIYFEDCNFSKANMSRVFLGASTFKNCSFKGARLNEAGFSGSVFISCDLQDTDFSSVWCLDAHFKGCIPYRLDKIRGLHTIIEP